MFDLESIIINTLNKYLNTDIYEEKSEAVFFKKGFELPLCTINYEIIFKRQNLFYNIKSIERTTMPPSSYETKINGQNNKYIVAPPFLEKKSCNMQDVKAFLGLHQRVSALLIPDYYPELDVFNKQKEISIENELDKVEGYLCYKIKLKEIVAVEDHSKFHEDMTKILENNLFGNNNLIQDTDGFNIDMNEIIKKISLDKKAEDVQKDFLKRIREGVKFDGVTSNHAEITYWIDKDNYNILKIKVHTLETEVTEVYTIHSSFKNL